MSKDEKHITFNHEAPSFHEAFGISKEEEERAFEVAKRAFYDCEAKSEFVEIMYKSDIHPVLQIAMSISIWEQAGQQVASNSIAQILGKKDADEV